MKNHWLIIQLREQVSYQTIKIEKWGKEKENLKMKSKTQNQSCGLSIPTSNTLIVVLIKWIWKQTKNK